MAHLQNKIKFSGPISVAEYMKEALTNAFAVSFAIALLSFVYICTFQCHSKDIQDLFTSNGPHELIN